MHPSKLHTQVISNTQYNKSMGWCVFGVPIFMMLSSWPPLFHEPDVSPVVLYEKIVQGPAYVKYVAKGCICAYVHLFLVDSS